MVVEIVEMALFALAVGRAEVCSAANQGGIVWIVAVGAWARPPGRGGTVGLIGSDERCAGGVVATLAVFGC